MKLSKRLSKVAQFVKPYRAIVDIGTDHALLPIYLLKHKIIDSCIATDNKKGPLTRAQENLTKHGFQNSAEVRLGDGLNPLTPNDNLDCIIIAGMGGLLIVDILEKGKTLLKSNKRLILQPNGHLEEVRDWLSSNYYEIVDEVILKEDGIYYEIICAERTAKLVIFNEVELKFGPKLLNKNDQVFYEKWDNLLKLKLDILDKIPDTDESKRKLQKEISMIKEILIKKD
ncbi:MAG: SAM-dependent methyltransferase [Bacilli bacterium]|nr:SAM-dependent methyltransferase [Bacilli bacterium]